MWVRSAGGLCVLPEMRDQARPHVPRVRSADWRLVAWLLLCAVVAAGAWLRACALTPGDVCVRVAHTLQRGRSIALRDWRTRLSGPD